jgi:hypothetical protein
MITMRFAGAHERCWRPTGSWFSGRRRRWRRYRAASGSEQPRRRTGFTAGLVLYAAWPPLVAFVVLSGPDERPLSRAAAAIIAESSLAALGLLGVASATVFDPRGQGCLACP